MHPIEAMEREWVSAKEFPEFGPGDTVRAHLKIIEGSKERVQVFQGVVIAIQGSLNRKNFILRKISQGGYGVERIIPYYSPALDKVEVVRYGRVRRAKLYYLRDRIGKAARIREKRRG